MCKTSFCFARNYFSNTLYITKMYDVLMLRVCMHAGMTDIIYILRVVVETAVYRYIWMYG
jgi:hypothetical protein